MSDSGEAGLWRCWAVRGPLSRLSGHYLVMGAAGLGRSLIKASDVSADG